MTPRNRPWMSVLLAALMLAGTGAAFADDDDDRGRGRDRGGERDRGRDDDDRGRYRGGNDDDDRRRPPRDTRPAMSLEAAVAMVERRFNARAVRADSDGGVYRIRLLGDDGRVFTVSVDAATGAIR